MPPPEAQTLREITPRQWKSGIAAWLGWMFDGLDMHIYTLVATAFVAKLLMVGDTAHPDVKEKASWIQAAFLVGWAVGGGIFGRIGDLIGRARALSLTVLTYAMFTGLSFFAQEWWHLLIFRFVAALGIGGEWAVGSTLLAETWPAKWRPWAAAVLQTGVNIGVLLACVFNFLFRDQQPNMLFLVGILPAIIVWWIRRNVPEPDDWAAAKSTTKKQPLIELFRGKVLRITVLSVIVCSCSLTAWWAFLFWHIQHVRHTADTLGMTTGEINALTSTVFFMVIFVSIVGNFVAGWIALKFGYRKTIAFMFAGFSITSILTFGIDHSFDALARVWLPAVGFWSGVFGLFTMFLPPLFPTLLRTTGAGFSYNVGRISGAIGTVVAAGITSGIDFRQTLLYTGLLWIPPIIIVFFLPEPHDGREELQPVD